METTASESSSSSSSSAALSSLIPAEPRKAGVYCFRVSSFKVDPNVYILVKIGVSKDLKQRLDGFKTSVYDTPADNLVCLWHSPSLAASNNMPALERLIHQIYADYRESSGEFFKFPNSFAFYGIDLFRQLCKRGVDDVSIYFTVGNVPQTGPHQPVKALAGLQPEPEGLEGDEPAPKKRKIVRTPAMIKAWIDGGVRLRKIAAERKEAKRALAMGSVESVNVMEVSDVSESPSEESYDDNQPLAYHEQFFGTLRVVDDKDKKSGRTALQLYQMFQEWCVVHQIPNTTSEIHFARCLKKWTELRETPERPLCFMSHHQAKYWLAPPVINIFAQDTGVQAISQSIS